MRQSRLAARFCRVATAVASLAGLACIAGFSNTASAQPSHPNVIVILSDDAGYSDFGFSAALNGTSFIGSTPNIDALAAQSVVARQGYASPLCSPTRVGLITGQYQQRIGVERVLGNEMTQPWGLTANSVTVADRMKSLGYHTGMVGKWHIGFTQGVNRPNDAGFDEFFGFLSGSRGYYLEGKPDNQMYRNTTNVESQWRTQGNTSLYDPTNGRYVTDALGEEAAAFINNHAADANPFFLYLPLSAPHDPYNYKQQDYDAFPSLTGSERINAAMVRALDRSVGMVTGALTANGIDNNTIVIFLNDNGGAGPQNNLPFNGGKNTVKEGGIRVPYMIKAPGVAPSTYNSPIDLYDIAATAIAAGGGTVDQSLDGVNLLPYLSGASAGDPHDALYFRNQGAWAIRQGNFKLGRMFVAGGIGMYNVATDPNETTNVLASQTALADQMFKKFTKWEATMAKPNFGSLGVDDRNRFDQFVYRVDQATTANWGDLALWTEGGVSSHVVNLTVEDAYANASLEFGVRQTGDYTATNNMLRMSGLVFMLNQMKFTGSYIGAGANSGTINGNAVLMVKNLAGQGPQLQFSATSANANSFAFNVSNEIQLLDNLEITGNGTQSFAVSGAIKDYDAPRNVLKTGSSIVTLRGANTFGGTLAVNGGRLRLDGATAAINNAASISVGASATFEINDGLVDTTVIDVASGGSLRFNPNNLVLHEIQTAVTNRGSTALTGTPATFNLDGNFTQFATGALGIRIAQQGGSTLVDKLSIAGTAQLAGGFDLDIVNLGLGSVLPGVGAAYQILSATGGVSGTFATADLPLADNGLGWQLVYTATTVSLKTFLAADFDANGIVNAADLSKWKIGFGITSGATRSIGDADSDGDVDSVDYFAWQRSLGFMNPPLHAVAGAVPEPTSAALLLMSAIALSSVRAKRRRVAGPRLARA